MIDALATGVPVLAGFLERNPGFDLLEFDFLAPGAVDRLHLPAEGAPETVELLKTYQRLVRIHPSAAVATALAAEGFHSAHQIADLEEEHFAHAVSDALGGDQALAREVHRRASTVKGQAIHLWATAATSVRSPLFRGTRVNTVPDALASFFESLPSYADLFGPTDYCSCQHCRSVLGPAAYFVDLMRITDRYATGPNRATIPAGMTLEERRPRLFTQKLTCAATTDTLPYLQVVNEVLADRASLELAEADVDRWAATAAYPFNLPQHLPLSRIRLLLGEVGLSLPRVYDAFAPAPALRAVEGAAAASVTFGEGLPETAAAAGAVVRVLSGAAAGAARPIAAYDAATRTTTLAAPWAVPPKAGDACRVEAAAWPVAREALALSLEQAAFASTPVADEKALRAEYGLPENGSLASLVEVPVFLRQTGMDRETLMTLLDGGLDAEERKAGLAHGFFVNRAIAGGGYLRIVRPETGPERLEPLDPATLDRVARFVRLAGWTGMSFGDLSWTLHSLGETEIGTGALVEVADAAGAAAALGLAPDAAAALWSEMKTVERGVGPEPADLWDRVWNAPAVRGDGGVYRPRYAGNPLFTDPVVRWRVDGGEAPGSGFGRTRLRAGLEVDDDTLTALGALLFGEGAEVELDVAALTRLFRAGTLLRLSGLDVRGYARVTRWLGMEPAGPFAPGEAVRLVGAARWMTAVGATPDELAFVLDGVSSPTLGASAREPRYDDLRGVWRLAAPLYATPASFRADVVPPALSRRIYDAVVDPRKGVPVRALGADYRAVFGGGAPELAMVLREVSDDDLAKVAAALTLTKRQTAVARDALNAVHQAQLQLAVGQLAGGFGVDAELAAAAARWAEAAGDPAWLETLLRPVREREEGSGGFTPGWREVRGLFRDLSRILLAASLLGLDAATVDAVRTNPAAFGVGGPAALTFADLERIAAFGELAARYADTAAWLDYLAMDPDEACEGGARRGRLAELTGWPAAQICRVAAETGEGPALYDTVPGIGRLERAFAVLAAGGVDADFAASLLALRSLPAAGGEGADWRTWLDTAGALEGAAAARLGARAWEAAAARVGGVMRERRRDVLEGVVLWRLGRRHGWITDRRQLYGFLLIDVEMSGCADTSRVAEGIAAVQLYLQRCRLSLEPGVETLAVPGAWWEWLGAYRVWEANRKIFLYPENYLVPSLRGDRTELFRGLQDALQQTNITDATVAAAYGGYLDGLEHITTLAYADAHRAVVDDPRRGEVDTLFVFARTRDEPYTFYWARREEGGPWSEWLKVGASIRSPYVTPVYAFGRLFVFWVELKEVMATQIRGADGSSRSENTTTHFAAIRYAFQDVNGGWTAAQTLFEDQVAYVAPSKSPFDSLSGYDLFNLSALFWRKCSALRVTPDRLSAPPAGAGQGEKLVILYGPFIENNETGSTLKEPSRPDPALAVQEPSRYRFEVEVFNRIGMVNQAARTRTRGDIPLQRARVLNRDLNLDFLMRQTEFHVLAQNRSPGAPPALEPLIDVPTGALHAVASLNPLRSNYYGDWTPPIASAALPRRVRAADFVLPGIGPDLSAQALVDLKGGGVVDEAGNVSPSFTTNTSLDFLLQGVDKRETLVAEVQQILLELRARGRPAAADSFLLDAIDAPTAEQVLADLVGGGVVSDTGRVSPTLTSRTDLSFVLDGTEEPQKSRLIFEIRRVLMSRLGDPRLLGAMARENAATLMVKNQPAAFLVTTGAEAFAVRPDGPALPQLSRTLRVREVESTRRVTESSFIVPPDLDEKLSKQAFDDLVGAGVLADDGVLNPGFGPSTSLAFLFDGFPERVRALLAAEVRRVLLGLPTVTALSWFAEDNDLVLAPAALRALGIGEEAAREAFDALVAHGVVSAEGTVSRAFRGDTDLSFLYPGAGTRRAVLIEETRTLLRRYFAAVWERTIHDLRFRFERMTTATVSRLSGLLLAGGIDRLLSLESQQAPVVPLVPFSQYEPSRAVVEPALFDGAQVDFDGPYGTYYWELFFHTPQLVAPTLAAAGRYQDALRWHQYVLDPTARFVPLGWADFVTPDIVEDQARKAFDALRAEGVVTAGGEVEAGFGPETDLSFLFPQVSDPAQRALMIREARNVLLNHAVSTPGARYWRFMPFRRHTLDSLVDDLTDPAQLRAYQDDPFDPFAIARLRIGAFEKAAFMGYVDTLVEWGDSLFAQKTRESLAAATLLYLYADELLGDRPADLGPCSTGAPASFEEIRRAYADDPGGIPPFLIDLEHVLGRGGGSGAAPVPSGSGGFNDVEALFCVPENEALLGCWDRVADRLYKLRHCLDLEGQPLVLPLFAPPLDPMALVRAAAAGGQGGLAPSPQQQAAVPVVRYSVLGPLARSVVGDLTSLGSALAAALTQRDGEALGRLRAAQEQAILNLTTRVKTLQVEEASSQVEALRQSRAALQGRRAFYEGLLKEFMSPAEITHLALSSAALLTNVGAGIAEAVAAIAYAVPQVGAPTAMTYGGIQLGNSATKWAAVLNSATKALEFGAQTSLTVAGYQRRGQDWAQEVAQAGFDLAQTDRQIAAAEAQLSIARRDLEVHLRTLEQGREYADFLVRKFDSQELYAWMAGRLGTLYFQTYRLALEATLAAQSAYQYELNRDDVFVDFGGWDEGHRGLLAGEALSMALDQMDLAYVRGNVRRHEITKTVSLAQLAPQELLRLRATGACDVRLTEALFDFDFPGHYCRRLYSVELTLATAGEDDEAREIHATVAQTRNAFLAEPSDEGLAWMLAPQGEPPASVRVNWQSSQVVAVSTSDLGTGLWELLIAVGDRLFPFEGTGAVSDWTVSMPPETNRFDFNDITDLKLTLRYTALDGGEPLRKTARSLLSGPRFRASAVLSLATDFPKAWTAFMEAHGDPDAQAVSFEIGADDLLPNVSGYLLDQVDVWIAVPPGTALPRASTFLTLAPGSLKPARVSLAGAWGTVETGGAGVDRFAGSWTLTADLKAMRADPELARLLADGFLDPDAVLDLGVALTYRAAAFPA